MIKINLVDSAYHLSAMVHYCYSCGQTLCMARVLMHSSSHSQVTVNLATVAVRQFTCICSHIGRSLNLFLSGWVRMWIVDVCHLYYYMCLVSDWKQFSKDLILTSDVMLSCRRSVEGQGGWLVQGRWDVDANISVRIKW